MNFLAKRAHEIRLVVPESATGRLATEIPCPIATLLEIFASRPDEFNLLVHVQANERRIIAELRRQYPDKRMLSLTHDVLPVLSGRGDPLDDRLAMPAAAAPVKYAIICPP